MCKTEAITKVISKAEETTKVMFKAVVISEAEEITGVMFKAEEMLKAWEIAEVMFRAKETIIIRALRVTIRAKANNPDKIDEE